MEQIESGLQPNRKEHEIFASIDLVSKKWPLFVVYSVRYLIIFSENWHTIDRCETFAVELWNGSNIIGRSDEKFNEYDISIHMDWRTFQIAGNVCGINAFDTYFVSDE